MIQLLGYNGQQQPGFNAAGYWQGGGNPMMWAGGMSNATMTPFSQMLRPQREPGPPIIPTPFAGWGNQPGGQQALSVPAAPTMRNPQAPQAQPTGNAGGTNWNLAKIQAFQNTGR